MGDEKLANRTDAQKVEWKRRRRRTRMRWEDCIRKHQERAWGDWRPTAADRRIWRQLIENVASER